MLVWFVSQTATESRVRCGIPHWDHRNRPGGTVGLQKKRLEKALLGRRKPLNKPQLESLSREVQLDENVMLQQVC